MTLTNIGALPRRWIEVLTVTYFAWREAWRARQTLSVACENGRFVVRKSRLNRDNGVRREQPNEPLENLAVLAAGEPIPARVTRAASNGFVVFQLPDELVVVRRIAVPVQAREFLPGIIRNQLERLSPWHADHVVYGFDADVDAEDAATLDVRVFVALRADVDRARAELAAIGLLVDRIVTRQTPSYGPSPGARASRPPLPVEDAGETLALPAGQGRIGARSVTLWSRLADVSPEHLAQACRRVGAGIAAAVVASLGLSLWTMTAVASLGGESEEVAARIRTLQRQIQGPTAQSVASLSPSERAWYAKETSPTAAIVLEALSRALPDGAYLTELRLENATLRMVGLANDAPSLIAPLEHSGHLNDVHFFAPTTRGPDGVLFRFNIEARVEPHFKIAEEEP
jgi:general secretion pathway protein L